MNKDVLNFLCVFRTRTGYFEPFTTHQPIPTKDESIRRCAKRFTKAPSHPALNSQSVTLAAPLLTIEIFLRDSRFFSVYKVIHASWSVWSSCAVSR
jgi:hypothetical protein